MKHTTIDALLHCQNRRVAPRLKKDIEVEVRGLGQTRSINISQTGLRLISNQALPEGLHLEFDLRLDQETTVEFQGRAVWQEPLGGVHVVGVHFEPNQQLSTPHLISWLRYHGLAA